MISRPPSDGPKRPSARLYLVTPPVSDAARFAETLDEALAASDVAAVLLRLEPGDERTLIERAKALVPVTSGRGVALLLDGHEELVARAGADGAHLTGVEALKAALPRLKPDRIAGAGGLRTRHDAMLAGESGADYVMFGEALAQPRRPPFAAILERVAWWTELFEIPCVGYATALEEIDALCAAGAEFIALGDALFADPRGAATAIVDAAARLTQSETPA